MQIIRHLEPSRRNVYCGSIGYIGLDGAMCMNVAIRTMILDRGRLHLYSGGAVVADSDPQAEYDETLAKARGMFRALGHEASATAVIDRMAVSAVVRPVTPACGRSALLAEPWPMHPAPNPRELTLDASRKGEQFAARPEVATPIAAGDVDQVKTIPCPP